MSTVIKLRKPVAADLEFWLALDPDADAASFQQLLSNGCARVIAGNQQPIGLMWYTILWHKLPFLNLLILLPEFRKQRLGCQALGLWEHEMKALGFDTLLVSTQADETAQGFFRKLGYRDCGSLVLTGTPLEQPLELFMLKTSTI